MPLSLGHPSITGYSGWQFMLDVETVFPGGSRGHIRSLTCSFFLVGLEFELRASLLQSTTTSATPAVHFALVVLETGSPAICPGWPQTAILRISASQVELQA
jgi:hypothetical protein